MRSDPRAWSAVVEDERFVMRRTLRALLAPYLPIIAVTLGIAPFVFLVLLPLAGSPTLSPGLAMALMLSPMLLVVVWARRLAAERMRIVLVREASKLRVSRRELELADLVRVLVLGSSRGHGTLGIVIRRGSDEAFLELVTMKRAANAAAVAAQLAGWLRIDVELDPPAVA